MCFSRCVSNLAVHPWRLALMLRHTVIGGAENKNPQRLNLEIIKSLQTTTAPGIFTPRVVYDGRKNIFAPRKLPFPGDADVHEVRACRLRRVCWSFCLSRIHSLTLLSTIRTALPTRPVRPRRTRSS
jgi:hypothetical protein